MIKTRDQIQQEYQSAVTRFQTKTTATPIPARPLPIRSLVNPTYSPAPRYTRVYQDDDIKRLAPSVFAAHPWEETSSNYRFLPTINIVNAFRDMGYSVTQAMQSRTRIEGKREFVKHIVRLRHADYIGTALNVGDEVPELVLINAHSGASAYKLMLGFFRLVCSNGMIVASSTIDSLSVRHTGRSDLLRDVIDVSSRVIQEAPKAIAQIATFKGITLTPDDQLAMAKAALELQASSLKTEPQRLLSTRRYDDKGTSLWQTANVIQENLIKGGVYGQSESGQFRRSREVKSIDSNISINRAVWRLAEEMAKLKG